MELEIEKRRGEGNYAVVVPRGSGVMAQSCGRGLGGVHSFHKG